MDLSRPGIFLIYLSLFPIAYYYKFQQDNNKIGDVHAFTNKDADKYGKKFNLPLAYDKKADGASWNDFLSNLAQL